MSDDLDVAKWMPVPSDTACVACNRWVAPDDAFSVMLVRADETVGWLHEECVGMDKARWTMVQREMAGKRWRPELPEGLR